MSSEITRKNVRGFTEQHRPTFLYPAEMTWTTAPVELIESLRNVAEDIHKQLQLLNNKQMLQCDVRADIRKMRIALEKIARNTAKGRRRKAESRSVATR